MELKSTSSFKDIDIDAMLEHTTLDEFMRGLYINKKGGIDATAEDGQQVDVSKIAAGNLGLLSSMAKGKKQEEDSSMPSLYGNENLHLNSK